MDRRTPASNASDDCSEAWLDSMPRRTSPHKSGSQLALRVALTDCETPALPPLLLTPVVVVLELELLPPTPRAPESPTPTVGHNPARLDATCACARRYAASARSEERRVGKECRSRWS